MERTKVDSALERQFLRAMAQDQHFLASAAGFVDPELFQTRYSQQVAKWCLDFFKKYGKPPNRSLEAIYHSWVDKDKPDPNDAAMVEDFLAYLSEEADAEPEKLNVPFLLEEASNYLTMRRMLKVGDAITTSDLTGDRELGLSAISNFSTISLGAGHGIDVLNDKGAWQRAFADTNESIIDFSGDAGAFFNQALCRECLVGIQGPEKRGKTFWLIEFAFRALRARRKVAFFEVGDLTETQLMRRFGVRIAQLPMWEYQLKGVEVPKSLEVTDGKPSVSFDTRTYPRTVNQIDVLKARHSLFRRMGIPKRRPYFLFSYHPNCSINVQGIHGILERWRHEQEFIPDVIIIDYADILAPEDARKEPRHQVNDTWRALRRLSQEWHALTIVPTQADAGAYDKKTQGMKNFSEDKRKYAHVTGMLGLNQTAEEKKQGVTRLNWIVLRESDYNIKECLWVAQCLPLGMAMVKSCREKR